MGSMDQEKKKSQSSSLLFGPFIFFVQELEVRGGGDPPQCLNPGTLADQRHIFGTPQSSVFDSRDNILTHKAQHTY